MAFSCFPQPQVIFCSVSRSGLGLVTSSRTCSPWVSMFRLFVDTLASPTICGSPAARPVSFVFIRLVEVSIFSITRVGMVLTTSLICLVRSIITRSSYNIMRVCVVWIYTLLVVSPFIFSSIDFLDISSPINFLSVGSVHSTVRGLLSWRCISKSLSEAPYRIIDMLLVDHQSLTLCDL